MIVVADTTPFNYLIQMNAVTILRDLYGKVVVPSAVLRELQSAGAPEPVRTWANDLPTWITVVEVEAALQPEISRLGAGEREAISFALDGRAELVIIDDGPARRVALSLQIDFIGTLGVLREAAERGLLMLPESILQLRRIGFRIADSIVEEILSEAEAERRCQL